MQQSSELPLDAEVDDVKRHTHLLQPFHFELKSFLNLIDCHGTLLGGKQNFQTNKKICHTSHAKNSVM